MRDWLPVPSAIDLKSATDEELERDLQLQRKRYKEHCEKKHNKKPDPSCHSCMDFYGDIRKIQHEQAVRINKKIKEKFAIED